MKLTVNEKAFEVPFDPSAIPLGRFLAYYDRYGRDLDNALKDISQRDYRQHLAEKGFATVTDEDIELHQTFDIDDHLDREALCWFAFWTDTDPEDLRACPLAPTLLVHYRLFRQITLAHNPQDDFPASVEWDGERWTIQDFRVDPQSDMTFNEIITAKEVTRQVHALGKGKWDALPYLCAVFFRREGEPFHDNLVAEGGERLQRLAALPLHHALRVGFFLSVCVAIWNSSLAFSPEREAEATASPK